MDNNYTLYKKELSGEFLQTFDKIEAFCYANNMPTDIIEERLMELIDVFITSQREKKPVKTIVGGNI